MSDPLAGKREALNKGELAVLTWPDEGKGCPVDVGETFDLRRCSIEITRKQRVQRGKGLVWVANFTRYGKSGDKDWILSRRGYVHDARGALGSGEEQPEWEVASSDKYIPTGPPPEPAGIDPEKIKNLPTSVAARARFEATRQADEQRRRVMHLSGRLRSLHNRAEREGTSELLAAQIAEVEKAIDQVEAIVIRNAA